MWNKISRRKDIQKDITSLKIACNSEDTNNYDLYNSYKDLKKKLIRNIIYLIIMPTIVCFSLIFIGSLISTLYYYDVFDIFYIFMIPMALLIVYIIYWKIPQQIYFLIKIKWIIRGIKKADDYSIL